jgi:hypothetical protein
MVVRWWLNSGPVVAQGWFSCGSGVAQRWSEVAWWWFDSLRMKNSNSQNDLRNLKIKIIFQNSKSFFGQTENIFVLTIIFYCTKH